MTCSHIFCIIAGPTSETIMDSPAEQTAIQIAVLLDRFPAMASQIKQHIPQARLIELLALGEPVKEARARPADSVATRAA